MSSTPPPAKTILLIDHMGSRQSAIVKKLEERGFVVNEITTGRQGISFLLSNPKDLALVVVQANIPDIPAMDIVKHIRTDTNLSELPVVLSCTYLPAALLQEAASQRVNGVMATPTKDSKNEDFNGDFDSLLKKLSGKKLDVKLK